MKAIVCGAGVAGPMTAIALKRAGVDAAIYEARARPDIHAGLFLGIAANGMRVLEEFDLLRRLEEHVLIPTPMMTFLNAKGRRLGRVSNGHLASGNRPVTLMRGALNQALADAATERGITIRYGAGIRGYRQENGAVRALFSDGSEVEADLIIGADGVHSQLRTQMIGHRAQADYTGLINLGGIVSGSGLAPTPDEMVMIWGSRAFFGYTVRPNGEAWWFANIGAPEVPKRGTRSATEHWRTLLVDLFADDLPLIRQLVEATAEIGAHPIYDVATVPTWHQERAVLIGDAAHATSPSSGQGASLALEDAVVLAKSLRDIGDPIEAVARFEALRRERAERIVSEGRKRGSYKAPATRLQLWLRDLLMPVAFRFFATERSMAWIYDYDVKWEAWVEA